MPELPEVETIARYLHMRTQGHVVGKVHFYRKDLREPIPTSLFRKVMEGQALSRVFRRSKYLLLETARGHGIIHLGMTGNLLFMESKKAVLPHTHLVLALKSPRSEAEDSYLHYIDPRRFGRISVHPGGQWQAHPFIANLGREPLEGRGLGKYLWQTSRSRKAPIKNFLMDAKTMVGVGNIYACEALFRAGIHPERPASELSLAQYELLAKMIRSTLKESIKAGGTSFRDYKDASGNPGYFSIALRVYGRKNEPCLSCGKPVLMIRQAGRSTWFCSLCQN